VPLGLFINLVKTGWGCSVSASSLICVRCTMLFWRSLSARWKLRIVLWNWIRDLMSWRTPRRFSADFRPSRRDLMKNRLSETWAEAEEKRMQLSEDPVMFSEQVGFDPVLLGSIKYNLEKLKSMNPTDIMECREILTSVRNPRLKKFANSHAAYGWVEEYRKAVRKASLTKLARMLKAPSFLAQTKVYLLWENPCARR